MKYLISAGHTPSGTLGCGAVDLIDESNCTREVAKLVVNKLKSLVHEVYLNNLIEVTTIIAKWLIMLIMYQ